MLLFSKDCGQLAPPVNGSVHLSNGTTLGSVAYYFCDNGYTSTTPMTRVCTENSVWRGFAPVCVKSKI